MKEAQHLLCAGALPGMGMQGMMGAGMPLGGMAGRPGTSMQASQALRVRILRCVCVCVCVCVQYLLPAGLKHCTGRQFP